jgi:phosphatidylglycerophosphate synthase
MGELHARDALRVPNLISALRLPLAVAFPFAVHRPAWALAIMAAAALTDVVDGYVARRFHQVTALGTVVDGVTDKLFATTVVVTLVVSRHLSTMGTLCLLAREILELPLVFWSLWSRAHRNYRKELTSANVLGKGATVLLFLAVAAVLLPDSVARPFELPLVCACGVIGALAAASYWRRVAEGRPIPPRGV